MICKLPEGAKWSGNPIEKMNATELKLILAYKLYEIDITRAVMSKEQIARIEEGMKGVHVPLVVRKEDSGS